MNNEEYYKEVIAFAVSSIRKLTKEVLSQEPDGLIIAPHDEDCRPVYLEGDKEIKGFLAGILTASLIVTDEKISVHFTKDTDEAAAVH
jgi:hypothetical protein